MSGGHLVNNAEWLALRGVDWLARDLYGAIRRSMDFKTGIVGDKAKRISWQALREDTEVLGRPGVKTVKPSEHQLRRRVGQLVREGLVEVISTSTHLRFRLLLATRLSRAPKKAAPPSQGVGQPAKPPRKPARRIVHNESSPKAAPHLECPVNPIKTTPPNPPVPEHEGEQVVPPTPSARAGELDPQQQIEPPAPGAREDGKDCQPPSRSTRQRPSEERRRSASRRGDGPAARQSEKGRGKSLGWKPGCAWPIGLTAAERRDVAKMHDEVGPELGQRVFDELRGAMEAGTVHYPWGLMQHLFQRARDEPGWRPEHADRIAEQRARWRQTQEVLAAQEAAHAERWGLAPRPVAALTGDTWPAGEWPEVEP